MRGDIGQARNSLRIRKLGGAGPPSFYPGSGTEQAAATAAYMAQLEARGDYALLYAWMHPDSQASVSREVVLGWYANEWAPRGPGPISVDRAEIVEWTWEVTGTVYSSAAEIHYHQAFADGTEVENVVRLVRHNGAWCWFFGPTRQFVREQIARYSHGEEAPVPRAHAIVGSSATATSVLDIGVDEVVERAQEAVDAAGTYRTEDFFIPGAIAGAAPVQFRSGSVDIKMGSTVQSSPLGAELDSGSRTPSTRQTRST